MSKQIVKIENTLALTPVENVVVDKTPPVVEPLQSVPSHFDAAQTMEDLFHARQEALRMAVEKHKTSGPQYLAAVEQITAQYEARHAALAKEQP